MVGGGVVKRSSQNMYLVDVSEDGDEEVEDEDIANKQVGSQQPHSQTSLELILLKYRRSSIRIRIGSIRLAIYST